MEILFEGRMRGKAKRKRKHLLNDLMKVKHVALKSRAEDRKEWQKLIELEVIHLLLNRLLREGPT